MAEHIRGAGSRLKVSISSSYTAVEQQTAFTPPSTPHETIETTELGATSLGFDPTIPGGGEASVTFNVETAGTAQAYLRTNLNTPPATADSFKTYKADNTTAVNTFSAWITGFTYNEVNPKSIWTAQVTLKVTGAIS